MMSCSPGNNTGVGCHILFQVILLTQGSNPGHLLGRCTLPLSHLSDFCQDIIIMLHQMLSGEGSTRQAGNMGMILGLGRFPWRRKWQHTPVFLPGKSHGQRSLEGYSPWALKELDTTEQLNNDNCISVRCTAL